MRLFSLSSIPSSTLAEETTNTLMSSKSRLSDVSSKLSSSLSKDKLKYSFLVNAVRDLETTSLQADFWNNQATAQDIMSDIGRKKAQIARIDTWNAQKEEVQAMLELAQDDPVEAEAYLQEAQAILTKLEADLLAFTEQSLMNGPFDTNSCLLSVTVGTGGLDAQEWVEMLYRMYSRYAERKGFRVTVLDESRAEVRHPTPLQRHCPLLMHMHRLG